MWTDAGRLYGSFSDITQHTEFLPFSTRTNVPLVEAYGSAVLLATSTMVQRKALSHSSAAVGNVKSN